MGDPLFVFVFLSVLVALAEWIGDTSWGRHLGSALWVIVLTAVAANLGIVPTYSGDVAVYAGIFTYVAPIAIFLLVLQVNLRDLLQAGLPMIGMFLVGAAGTTLGVLTGLWWVGGEVAFGPLYNALGGMFTATYVGGSMNYNAVALHYDVVKQPTLYAGAAAVDSAMTTVWMAVTVALPRLLGRASSSVRESETASIETARLEQAPASPRDLASLAALAGLSVLLSEHLAPILGLPSILIVTTLALILAQWRPIQRLKGTELLGWLAVMYFLAVIGALCDVQALMAIGEIGVDLTVFVVILLTIHGLVVFGVGGLLKLDPTLTAVASQANIGGSTSALALARSLGAERWVLPGVLAGAMGNALGTYLGFAVAAFL